MKHYQNLFKQTAIYGLATVIPRMLSFLLVPLYTTAGVLGSVADYGTVSIIFSWFVLFNVLLSYGMETAFFRFFYKENDSKKVEGTAAIALIFTSLVFVILSFFGQKQLATLLDIQDSHFSLVAKILALDALAVIPFAWLRANGKAMRYAIIKIINVALSPFTKHFFLIRTQELGQIRLMVRFCDSPSI